MHTHQVELVFDNDGELTDVNPTKTGGGTKKPTRKKKIKIKDHLQNDDKCVHLTAHTFFYCNSPGCITYRTSSGYVTICW